MGKLHNRIKQYREERNISREELAKAIGVSVPRLDRFEKEIADPPMRVAYRILVYFDVNMVDMFWMDNDSTLPWLFSILTQ